MDRAPKSGREAKKALTMPFYCVKVRAIKIEERKKTPGLSISEPQQSVSAAATAPGKRVREMSL